MRPRFQGSMMLEILIGITLLLFVAAPLVTLAVRTRGTAVGTVQRLSAELRVRRYTAEMATTTYNALLLTLKRRFPLDLEPPDPAAAWQEDSRVTEVEPGLLALTATVRWIDRSTGNRSREVTARRLLACPTLSLQARFPMRRFGT